MFFDLCFRTRHGKVCSQLQPIEEQATLLVIGDDKSRRQRQKK